MPLTRACQVTGPTIPSTATHPPEVEQRARAHRSDGRYRRVSCYQDPPARRGGAGISIGRRTRQILSVSSVAPVSSWSRQQAEKRIRVAAGALFENRADNKLARMSVVMLHVKTVALVSSPCLNGAHTP